VLAIGTTTINHQWTTVSPDFFHNEHVLSDFIVLLGVPTYSGTAPGVVRIKNLNDNSFKLKFQEFSYDDGFHASEQVDYMVVKRGRSVLKNGASMEAGTFKLDGTGLWKQYTFSEKFHQKPRIVANMQTTNGVQAALVRIRHISTTGFQAAIFEEQQSMGSGHQRETVAFMAMGNGKKSKSFFDINGEDIRFDTATRMIGNSGKSLLNPEQSRVFGLPSSELHQEFIILQEETSADPELVHLPERIDVFKVGDALFAQSVSALGPDPFVLRKR
jgi:hypothetical protein